MSGLQVRSAEQMRQLANTYLETMSDELVEKHYANIIAEAKRGQYYATFRLCNLYDALSEVNHRVLEKLSALFPMCALTFVKKECIRGEYLYTYEIRWGPSNGVGALP